MATITVDFVNPFLQAAITVFEQLLHTELRKGKLTIKESPFPSHNVAIIIGVKGDYDGVVVYSLSYDTGMKIVYSLNPGITPKQMREMYVDVLGEIANMVTGNAISLFAKKGKKVEITVPQVYTDVASKKLKFPAISTVAINLYSTYGLVEANVALLRAK